MMLSGGGGGKGGEEKEAKEGESRLADLNVALIKMACTHGWEACQPRNVLWLLPPSLVESAPFCLSVFCSLYPSFPHPFFSSSHLPPLPSPPTPLLHFLHFLFFGCRGLVFMLWKVTTGGVFCSWPGRKTRLRCWKWNILINKNTSLQYIMLFLFLWFVLQNCGCNFLPFLPACRVMGFTIDMNNKVAWPTYFVFSPRSKNKSIRNSEIMLCCPSTQSPNDVVKSRKEDRGKKRATTFSGLAWSLPRSWQTANPWTGY